jgi:hypothetical protein
MTPRDADPLRGHAAWTAARDQVAKKNAATREQARKQRAARNAEATARRIEEERQERASLPRTHLR